MNRERTDLVDASVSAVSPHCGLVFLAFINVAGFNVFWGEVCAVGSSWCLVHRCAVNLHLTLIREGARGISCSVSFLPYFAFMISRNVPRGYPDHPCDDSSSMCVCVCVCVCVCSLIDWPGELHLGAESWLSVRGARFRLGRAQ